MQLYRYGQECTSILVVYLLHNVMSASVVKVCNTPYNQDKYIIKTLYVYLKTNKLQLKYNIAKKIILLFFTYHHQVLKTFHLCTSVTYQRPTQHITLKIPLFFQCFIGTFSIFKILIHLGIPIENIILRLSLHLIFQIYKSMIKLVMNIPTK